MPAQNIEQRESAGAIHQIRKYERCYSVAKSGEYDRGRNDIGQSCFVVVIVKIMTPVIPKRFGKPIIEPSIDIASLILPERGIDR